MGLAVTFIQVNFEVKFEIVVIQKSYNIWTAMLAIPTIYNEYNPTHCQYHMFCHVF